MIYLAVWMGIGLVLAAFVTCLIAPERPHTVTIVFTTFLWPVALVYIATGVKKKLNELGD